MPLCMGSLRLRNMDSLMLFRVEKWAYQYQRYRKHRQEEV